MDILWISMEIVWIYYGFSDAITISTYYGCSMDIDYGLVWTYNYMDLVMQSQIPYSMNFSVSY
jgi:hypothetical protein